MSDQGEALAEFTEEDIGVWVLDGLQQVVEERYLRDHRGLLVGLLAMVWQVLVPVWVSSDHSLTRCALPLCSDILR